MFPATQQPRGKKRRRNDAQQPPPRQCQECLNLIAQRNIALHDQLALQQRLDETRMQLLLMFAQLRGAATVEETRTVAEAAQQTLFGGNQQDADMAQ